MPQPTPNLIAPPPALYLGTLVIGLLAQGAFPLALPTAEAAQLVGALLLLASAAFARWAFVTMGRAGTSASPRQASVALTTDGPFAYSRNPIYVAMTGLYLGFAAVVGAGWPLVLLPALLAAMHWGVVLREERYLAEQFGVPYLAYCARVRRWL